MPFNKVNNIRSKTGNMFCITQHFISTSPLCLETVNLHFALASYSILNAFCMEAIQICPGFLFPPLSTIILMTLIPPVVSLYFIAIPPAIVLPYQIVNNHKYHAAVHYLQLKFLWGLFRYYWNIYSNSLKKQINSCKFIKMLLRMNFTKVKYL